MSLALAFTTHGQPFNAARDLGGNSTWVPFPGTAGRGGTVPGSFPGISPQVTIPTQQGASASAPFAQASQIPRNRTFVKHVFPTTSVFEGYKVMTGTNVANVNAPRVEWAQTPFRIAMNAGDLLSRQTAPGGSNQVKGSVGPGQTRYTRGARPSQGGGVFPGNGASGNQHFVYDSSDYIKYKKMSAINRNYNDIGFGGAGLSGVGVGQSMFKIAGRNNPDGKRKSGTLNWCKDGVVGYHPENGKVICCASSCGICGGAGCSGRPGGASVCCTGNINANGVVCATDSDVACIIPTQ